MPDRQQGRRRRALAGQRDRWRRLVLRAVSEPAPGALLGRRRAVLLLSTGWVQVGWKPGWERGLGSAFRAAQPW